MIIWSMHNLTQIKDFNEGKKINGYFLCVEKRIRLTKKGKQYIHLELKDSSGIISGKIWEKVNKLDLLFNVGDPVAVSGFIEQFQDILQLKVLKIDHATDEKYGHRGFDISKLIPVAKMPVSYLWAQAINLIDLIGSRDLRILVKKIYLKYQEEILLSPGSSKLHHNYRHGLLEHITSMARSGWIISRQYSLDTDLVMAGIFLHDIGKLVEIKGDYTFEYGNEGYLIGHLVLGWDMVREEVKKIKGFEKNVLLKLEHMILSHHGSYEWQSPKKPCFPEALLLHMLDHLDAQINLMFKVLDQDRSSSIWTTNRNYFNQALLKGFNEFE